MTDSGRKIQEVDQYIAELPEDIQAITESLREMILNTSSELKEEYKWSMPNYSYKGLVCYLQASKKHVNLGFQKGNELEAIVDCDILQGTGKTMRHVRIKSLDEINPELFTVLIQAAIQLNE
ncbi:DUF1801 domain-containing protein [Oceanobacillus luteolus]|uniref:DUF1801 domain-containing protein n=1 Tax=Oceanobacillus luteolus TaxID=1274358 RepID=UPI002040C123|nr:DUF1801 domain-containing protein [Oceanobacillus luteolus]MCM3741996.1 DUF1801 domain-containing protein [Oceanobacillus luteolus]